MGGSAKIDSVVYLNTGKFITVTGALNPPPGGSSPVYSAVLTFPGSPLEGTVAITGSTSAPYYFLTANDVAKFSYPERTLVYNAAEIGTATLGPLAGP
ncbi:hypothetical protein LQZ19_01280 [Treponema primitia]